jgi:light-regulated signal transduction histidine kinase (bacteriophytochrome)
MFKNVWDFHLLSSPHKAQLILNPLPKAKADASLIEQVVINLISNAVKYSSKKEAPVVTVSCKETGKKNTYSVKDNGAGFDMKNYSKLFGAFQRLHGMSEFEGTGVGLMLVKRIIDKHGGEIWAESIVGEGATFYFTLPAAKN